MISKQEQDDVYVLEMDERCLSPVMGYRVSDSELEYPEPNLFRWQRIVHHDDPHDITFEFGQGTLSLAQNTLLRLHRASEATGGYIRFPSECCYCPVLFGHDDRLVPLFEFVEALDTVVDYDRIKDELPSLSYAQIHGSLMFLRKVAQFNIIDKDIDEELADESVFLDELRRAFADQENTRVLNFNERDDRAND